jgi:hypothetical protein
MVVELSTLLDLTLGPPPSHGRNVSFPLIDLCRRGRAQAAADELERLRESIGARGWDYVRWMRNAIGAHLDDDLTAFSIQRHLIELDYQGVVRLTEHVLDWLDALGATQLDLGLLLIGERPIASWPTDPTLKSPAAPEPRAIPGALARLFRTIDSPYMSAAASSFGSPILAAITASRRATPRQKVVVPPQLNRWTEPRYIPVPVQRPPGVEPRAT